MSETQTGEARKIRVLITAGAIDGGRSGVGRYVIELVAALARDHSHLDLHVAGLDSDREHFPAIDDAHWVTIPACCSGGLMSFLWHQLVLPSRLRRLRIDLLHSPTYRRIVWRSPVPQVATIHDCAPFVLRDKYGFLRGLLGRWIAPVLARRCRRVIAVSHATASDLQRFMKIPTARLTTIWNGIDHEHYHPSEPARLEQFLEEREQRQPYFLYVARLEHPGKNHVGLIDAYERFREARPDLAVQLVLGGSDWMGAKVIHARIAASPWRGDIRVLGFVPDEDLPLWYSGCAAVVMPTLFEGFGLPVIEAYACGAAAGLSDIRALREVGGELADFFDARDLEAIAACLGRLADKALKTPRVQTVETLVAASGPRTSSKADPGNEQSDDRIREARIAWSDKFSWERCATSVTENYEKSHN